MRNIKYHIINTGAVLLFSYILAITISQFIRFNMTPVFSTSAEKTRITAQNTIKKNYTDYEKILESSFFKIANAMDNQTASNEPSNIVPGDLGDLQLLGTITGPASIARALIRKKREKESQIFKLWSDVYGYRLVRVNNSKVYLKKGESTEMLDMYAKNERDRSDKTAENRTISADTPAKTQVISRSEIRQRVNNIDSVIQGLRAGPYRVDGNVEGFKLHRVSSNNILYHLGLRSGDIVKRVNGHPIDSTEKLVGLWESVQGESKFTAAIERGGKLQTIELDLTD
jgi:type II secretion system protein C